MDIRLPEGGVVIGVGIDLVECARIRGVWERQGAAFLEKVYTERERNYCLAHRDPVPALAARFAAKEAISKAFTTGIGPELGWHSMEVIHGARQQPLVCLDAAGQRLLAAVGGTEVLLSLTHTSGHAQAVALVVRKV